MENEKYDSALFYFKFNLYCLFNNVILVGKVFVYLHATFHIQTR